MIFRFARLALAMSVAAAAGAIAQSPSASPMPGQTGAATMPRSLEQPMAPGERAKRKGDRTAMGRRPKMTTREVMMPEKGEPVVAPEPAAPPK